MSTTQPAPKMSEPKYEVNELVCVKDRGKIYEAKIITLQQWSDSWHYFVHFQGWNKKWDRWTEESEISKKTISIGRLGKSDGSEEVLNGNKVLIQNYFHLPQQRTNERKEAEQAKRRKQLEEENLVSFVEYFSFLTLFRKKLLMKHRWYKLFHGVINSSSVVQTSNSDDTEEAPDG